VTWEVTETDSDSVMIEHQKKYCTVYRVWYIAHIVCTLYVSACQI